MKQDFLREGSKIPQEVKNPCEGNILVRINISPKILLDMQLSKVLKRLMTDHDVKASQLSRATKVPVQTLSNWLGGQPPRNIDQVKAIADYFRVTLDFLLYGKDKPEKEIFEQFKDEINAGVFEVILRRVKNQKL